MLDKVYFFVNVTKGIVFGLFRLLFVKNCENCSCLNLIH